MDIEDKNCGVVFIASGAFHTAAAAEAARSVRASNPWLSLDLFTDVEDISGVFDQVTPIGRGHLRSKVDWLAASRFDRTLYLDSDTRVVADLRGLFEVLDHFDIALTHGHARRRARQNIIWRQSVPEAFPQLNGGVIAYRNNAKVLKFMEDWRLAYHEAGFKWDQITLRELLWNSRLRLYVLPPEYNVRYRKYLDIWDPEEAEPKILHFAQFYDEVAGLLGINRQEDTSLAGKLARAVKTVRQRIKA